MLPLPDPAVIRAAYSSAALALLQTADAVPAGGWDRPGRGEWTVKELLGHTLRALITVEEYLDVPGGDQPTIGTVEYLQQALASSPDVHARVAERGRQAGAALGDDPARAAREVVDRALARVAATGDDAACGTFVGPILLIDYLPTRVVELAVHTLDLQRATGQVEAIAPGAAEVVLATLGAVAAVRDPVPVVLALTGRGALPAGYNVLS